jgi:hypothetical protein
MHSREVFLRGLAAFVGFEYLALGSLYYYSGVSTAASSQTIMVGRPRCTRCVFKRM